MKTPDSRLLKKVYDLLEFPQNNYEMRLTLRSVEKQLHLKVYSQKVVFRRIGIFFSVPVLYTHLHSTLVYKGFLYIYCGNGDLYMWDLNGGNHFVERVIRSGLWRYITFVVELEGIIFREKLRKALRRAEIFSFCKRLARRVNEGLSARTSHGKKRYKYKVKTSVDKAVLRGSTWEGPLTVYHTFNFGNYYDCDHGNFGALRAINDCSVMPQEGMDIFPPQNIEIISIPLKGCLTHRNSENAPVTLTFGDIEVLSAGRGSFHSDYNDSKTEGLQFLQIWVYPEVRDTPPEYHRYDVRSVLKKNRLGFIIAPGGSAPASIRQKVWFSMGEFDAGEIIDYKMHAGDNGVYMFVISGEVGVLGKSLGKRDGIRIWDTEGFQVNVTKEAHLLLMEIPL